MEPPVNRPTYPESATKGGLDPQKRYPSAGGVLDPPDRGIFGSLSERLKRGSWSTFLGLSIFARAAIRLAITCQAWVSEAAQIATRQHENAVASASISSALRLLHPRRSPSIWGAWFVSVWGSRRLLRLDLPPQAPTPPLSWVSDPAQVALPAPIDALNRREPSEDDLASTPSASSIHSRSSRVGC